MFALRMLRFCKSDRLAATVIEGSVDGTEFLATEFHELSLLRLCLYGLETGFCFWVCSFNAVRNYLSSHLATPLMGVRDSSQDAPGRAWLVVWLLDCPSLASDRNFPKPVGSRAGAVFRGSSLAVAPRFLWECLNSSAVNPSPAPATSHPACRFPALGAPVCFISRVMWPIVLGRLSRLTIGGVGSC
jgi:hypothetical protein